MTLWRSALRCGERVRGRLLLSETRRLPRTKRNRRQLGISMDTPMGEDAETRLSCQDAEQQKLLEDMFGPGRRGRPFRGFQRL